MLLWQIFNDVKGQRVKNNIAIWSHWQQLCNRQWLPFPGIGELQNLIGSFKLEGDEMGDVPCPLSEIFKGT